MDAHVLEARSILYGASMEFVQLQGKGTVRANLGVGLGLARGRARLG